MVHVYKQVLTACLLISSASLFAQTTAPVLEREQLSSLPGIQTIDNKYSNESAVILFEKKRIEYVDENKDVAAYKTYHTRIHINDDKGIESFNKIYLPVASN